MISKVIAEDLIHRTQKEIDKTDKIVIVVHVGPDSDAMGHRGFNGTTWWQLKRTGCNSSYHFQTFWNWMPGRGQGACVRNTEGTERWTPQLLPNWFSRDFNAQTVWLKWKKPSWLQQRPKFWWIIICIRPIILKSLFLIHWNIVDKRIDFQTDLPHGRFLENKPGLCRMYLYGHDDRHRRLYGFNSNKPKFISSSTNL